MDAFGGLICKLIYAEPLPIQAAVFLYISEPEHLKKTALSGVEQCGLYTWMIVRRSGNSGTQYLIRSR